MPCPRGRVGSNPTRRMTRPADQVASVLALAADGMNQSEIARRTGIPRLTVNDWANGRTPSEDRGRKCFRCRSGHANFPEQRRAAYAYLLGLYLGDGHLARGRRDVWTLRVFLDRAYPVIVHECQTAMSLVLPTSRARIQRDRKAQMYVVCASGKHWPCALPQHGKGMKHQRPIRLYPWQREILGSYPWRFLRGLIHSDGCRFSNPAIHPQRTYRYTRYMFSNRSADIRNLFSEYCALVGVDCRPSNEWTVSIARRNSVALMDLHIGAKR